MENFSVALFIMSILNNPVFLILLVGFFFYKNSIGWFGELWTKEGLNKLDKNKYLLLHNIMIRTKDDKTHQIDHVVISKYGIFVIETKQYNGYIVGDDKSKYWKINKKIQVKNPLHQNYGHVMSLSEILELSEDKFINLVCISSNAKVKVKSENVVRNFNIHEKIGSYSKEIICDEQEIYDRILKLNITDKTVKEEHKKNIRKIINEQKILENERLSLNICPWCGNKLLVKNGKYGTFTGCSNYPRCKYIKK